LARKNTLSFRARLWRLIKSVVDPRAYLHMLKLLNFYNYSHVAPLRRIQRGRNVRVSPSVWFAEPDRIRIGNHVHLGGRCMIWAGASHGRIEIGDYALFGPNVMVTSANYRYRDGHPVTDQDMDEADVFIGRDVWIATGAVILPGTVLNDGCVVAANSVVRGTFPAMSVVAGAPGRVVSTRRTPAPERDAFFAGEDQGSPER